MVKNSKKVKKRCPANIYRYTHSDIMVELQSKYPGLYDLSKKTNHQLLDNISKTIADRLMKIMDNHAEASDGCFFLSQQYRKMHPHFGDFQLVLDTLHRLQDAAGQPREQISEQDISTVSIKPMAIDNIPVEKVKQACNKYCDKIAKKVSEHIDSLSSDVQDADTEEQIVRKKVRGELKKLKPYVPTIIRHVLIKNFVPEKLKIHPIHMYGEPYLPGKDTMSSFVRQYRPVKLHRSRRMYNLLVFGVATDNYAGLMAMDGTVLNGAKLVIRPYDMPFYLPSLVSDDGVPAYYAQETFDDEMEDMCIKIK